MTTFSHLDTCTPQETQDAVSKAIAAGFHYIVTFMGTLTFEEWLTVTALTAPLHYENGKLVTEWLKSILEPGKMERMVFELQ